MSLSIVIPTLNEERCLPGCLSSLIGVGAEVCVVDGGSEDCTMEIAWQAGVKVESASRGRGRQCNVGAAATGGEWLLFLHADCRLPAEAGAVLQAALADEHIGWGAFRHRIDSPRWPLRVIEATDNLRAAWTRRPYGDQGLLVRRGLFESVGGYPETPILEDVLLARRLRRAARFRLLRATLWTDARRWEQRGILRTTATNWAIMTAAACGVSLDKLARWYRGGG